MPDRNTTNLNNSNLKNIFTIECMDIVLREFQMEDLDAIYNITLQPEVKEFLPDWIATKEKRREWLTKYEIKENKEFLEAVPNIPSIKGHALRLGIILKETNELIGWITSGLKDELPPPNREIGYAISKDYTCKGYATQAVQGLTKYLFENTNTDVLNATALTYNIPSNRVIQKCGFRLMGTIEIDGQEFYYYKLNKDEWRNNKLMDLDVKQYKNEYKSAISELILENNFVKEDIIKCLEQCPNHGIIVEDEKEIIAVGVFTDEDKESSMALYVKPSRRKEGIGTMLLKSLEDNMSSVGVQKVVCDFKDNELEKSFLYKNGYRHWFYSNFMTYTDDKLTVDNYEIMNYEDKDYYECQKIFSEAFHKMRLLVGLESTLGSPSEKQKNAYKENADNIFILRNNNEIVAVARIEDNEIDGVAVDVDKQGKGYGKNLVSYSVNKLLDRGCEKVTLWVVEGNPAKFLYEKLGFTVDRMHEFVIKNIK